MGFAHNLKNVSGYVVHALACGSCMGLKEHAKGTVDLIEHKYKIDI
jgi:hypothetical protein